MNTNTTGIRTIRPLPFAEARSKEIESLGLFSDKKEDYTAALPRHLRRRAAAHRRFKRGYAPRRENGTTENRRSKRRRAQLREVATQQRFKRLETHEWHTKRMHMVDMWWGYRVGEHRSDIGLRSAARAATSSNRLCALHDASYQSFVELRGSERQIVETMLRMTGGEQEKYWDAEHLSGYVQTRSLELHVPGQYPFSIVCPVTFQWIPARGDKDRQAWIGIHPAATESALQAIRASAAESKVQVIHHQEDFVVFELFGSSLPRFLSSSLGIELSSESSLEGQRWSVEMCSSASDDEKTTMTTPSNVLTSKATIERERDLLRSLADSVDSKEKYGELVFHLERLEQERGGDVKISNKKLVSCSDKRWWQDDDDAKNTVQIISSPDRTRMDLIMRAGQGRALWNRLVTSGAVAIGLSERHYLRTRRGVLTFPQDYPESKAGRHHSNLEAKRLREIMLRKPKGKRVNHLVNSAPCPYELNWAFFFENDEEEEDVVESTSSPFCVPRDSNFAQLVRHSESIPESSFPTMIPVLIVMLRGGKISRGTMLFRCGGETLDKSTSKIKPEKPKVSSLSAMSHELLGFVTSSHDGFKTDACGGVALCDVRVLWKSIQDYDGDVVVEDAPYRENYEPVSLILTRNSSSLHFGLAWVYVRA
eukprot:g1933.t1